MTPEKNDATVLLRLPSDLKTALTREAFVNGRRITAEINMRLAKSLQQDATPVARAGLAEAGRASLDARVLEIVNTWSDAQKQAFLKLFT